MLTIFVIDEILHILRIHHTLVNYNLRACIINIHKSNVSF